MPVGMIPVATSATAVAGVAGQAGLMRRMAAGTASMDRGRGSGQGEHGGVAIATRPQADRLAAGLAGHSGVATGVTGAVAVAVTVARGTVNPMAGVALVVAGEARLGRNPVVTLYTARRGFLATAMHIVALEARGASLLAGPVMHRSVAVAGFAGRGEGERAGMAGVVGLVSSMAGRAWRVAVAGDGGHEALGSVMTARATGWLDGDIGAETVALQAIDRGLAQGRAVQVVTGQGVTLRAQPGVLGRELASVAGRAGHLRDLEMRRVAGAVAYVVPGSRDGTGRDRRRLAILHGAQRGHGEQPQDTQHTDRGQGLARPGAVQVHHRPPIWQPRHGTSDSRLRLDQPGG